MSDTSTTVELTEIEYERFQKLSAKLRNMSNNQMGSKEGKRVMEELSFDLSYVADKIDFELSKSDGR